MVGRRLLLLVAVLMGLTALAASVAPRQTGPEGPTAAPGRPPLQPTETAAPEGEPATPESEGQDALEETLSAAPGASQTRVRARPGQSLVLEVQGPIFDVVVVDGLDRVDAISPEAPARFDLLLDRPGTFPVTLQDAGRKLGEIVVRE